MEGRENTNIYFHFSLLLVVTPAGVAYFRWFQCALERVSLLGSNSQSADSVLNPAIAQLVWLMSPGNTPYSLVPKTLEVVVATNPNLWAASLSLVGLFNCVHIFVTNTSC